MGGYFQFFTKNRPQKHQKRTILHNSQANGGGLEPLPPPPPGYATLSRVYFPAFAYFALSNTVRHKI